MLNANWIVDAAMGQSPCGDPDRLALSLESDYSWTYRELYEHRNRYANAMLAMGITAGQRVGILMANSPEYLGLYFAIARIGAVAVRLNFRLTSRELLYAITDAEMSLLCVDENHFGQVEPLRCQLQARVAVRGHGASWTETWEPFEAADQTPPHCPEPALSDLMMLMYTSGTTGSPKAAMWRHSTAIECATKGAIELGLDSETVAMTAGPLYHAGAFECLLLPALLRRGRAIVGRSGGFDLQRMVNVMRSERVTHAMLYPFMLHELLAMDQFGRGLLPDLKMILTGGDIIHPSVIQAIRDRLPGIALANGFGLTEGPNVAILRDADLDKHPESIGQSWFMSEVAVVDDDGAPAPTGVVGEIVMRGAGVTDGYWNKPEANAATYIDGWCHTGDLGTMSVDGFVTIVGRRKDMIRSGGENIYPAEVEAVLSEHPGIADIAVVGVADARWLEVGCAVIVASGEALSDAELRQFARERLAAYKCPKHFVWVDALPRNAGGKVLKAELRGRYQDIQVQNVGARR
jgi:fatty-acyl-CoA synthase